MAGRCSEREDPAEPCDGAHRGTSASWPASCKTVIYQSGYLTIRYYDPEFHLHTLGYPNDEVRRGFLRFLLPYYTGAPNSRESFHISRFVLELREGDVDAFLTRLRAFFAGIPYNLNDQTERHYQVVFYLVFTLMGQFVATEVKSAKGRADAVVWTAERIFVFEFKLCGTAEQALDQIDAQGYCVPYQADGRAVVKVGVEFDKAARNIGRWLLEHRPFSRSEPASSQP